MENTFEVTRNAVLLEQVFFESRAQRGFCVFLAIRFSRLAFSF